MISMQLADILARIEERLAALNLSADTASKMAGKPDAIRNIRRAARAGTRQGVQTGTLEALAPVLKCSQGWLLTGLDAPTDEAVSTILSDETLPVEDAETAIAWAFQELAALPDVEARVLSRAVVRAIRTPSTPTGSPMSAQDRRALIETAIRLFRPR